MSKKAPSIDDHAIISDAAKLCGLSKVLLSRWIKDGRVPVRKWHFGKALVLLDDVRAALKDRPALGRPRKTLTPE